jgi:hypothetical protein
VHIERAARPRWLPAAVLGLLIVVLAIKAPAFVTPMGQDQGLYHAVGDVIRGGGVPYRDAWDPKPPGVFYAHAALLSMLGDPWAVCHVGTLPGIARSDLQPRCGALLFQVADTLLTLVLAGLVIAVGRRLGLPWAGAVLAGAATGVCSSLAYVDAEGMTPEKMALVPAVGAVLAGLTFLTGGRRGWLAVAGVCGAIAALFKPTAAASVVALTLLLVLGRHGIRPLVWLWAPLVVVLGGVGLVFAGAGAGAQLLDATVLYNVARFGFQSERIPSAAVGSVWDMARNALGVVWLVALVGVPIAWRSTTGRLLVLWAACDVAALFLGGNKFTRVYFIQLVPSTSLLAATAVSALWQNRRLSVAARGAVLLVLAGAVALSQAFQARATLRAWNDYVGFGWTTTSIERLASMVGSLPAGESVFVWGDEAQVYALTRRPPPARFFNLVGLTESGDRLAGARRDELFAALRRAPPAVIVVDQRMIEDDPSGALGLNPERVAELRQLLAERYQQMAESVLRPYPGGNRELVYVRSAEVCEQMPGCRLS